MHTGSLHLGHTCNILLAKGNHVAKSPQIKEAGNYIPLAVGGTVGSQGKGHGCRGGEGVGNSDTIYHVPQEESDER